MREPNFCFPSQGRASVCISSTTYDRRALDCTAALPLLNSLSHLTYLSTTSSRIRATLALDGGLERLIRLLETAKISDKKAAWKWSLAFQCIVNMGVHGTESVRKRVVEAGMLHIISTILEHYLRQCRHAQFSRDVQLVRSIRSTNGAGNRSTSVVDSTLPTRGTVPMVRGPRRNTFPIASRLSRSTTANGNRSSSASSPLVSHVTRTRPRAVHDFSSTEVGANETPFGSQLDSETQGDAPLPSSSNLLSSTSTASSSSAALTSSLSAPFSENSSLIESDVSSAEIGTATTDNVQPTPHFAPAFPMPEPQSRPQFPQQPALDAGTQIYTATERQAQSNSNGPSAPCHIPSSQAEDGSASQVTPHRTCPRLQRVTSPITILDTMIYRQEDILQCLQLLGYLSKYPSIRRAMHNCRTRDIYVQVEALTFPSSASEIQNWAAIVMGGITRRDDSLGGRRQCANLKCQIWESEPRAFPSRCPLCRRANYCSEECRQCAWSTGHQFWCSQDSGNQSQGVDKKTSSSALNSMPDPSVASEVTASVTDYREGAVDGVQSV